MAKADLGAMFPDHDTTAIQKFAADMLEMNLEAWNEYARGLGPVRLEQLLILAADMRESQRARAAAAAEEHRDA